MADYRAEGEVMLRSPAKTEWKRFFGISPRERTRRSREFSSEYIRRGERLEDRALLATVTVHVGNDFFNQSSVTIHPGDTVHWVFDQGVHSTTSVAGIAEEWDSGVITTEGATFDHTFTHTGSFAYYCTVHGFDQGNGRAGGMAGQIIVKNDVPLRSISVTPAFATLTPGAVQQFTATARYADGSTGNITNQVSWTSIKPAVATISSSGKVTGVSKGIDILIARLNGRAGVGVALVNAPTPTLVSAQRVTSGAGRKQMVTGIDLKFSGPLNGPVAQFAGHYQVTQQGKGRKPIPVSVSVLSASYNSATTTVRLSLAGAKANKPLSVTATGLLSATGSPLAPIVASA